MVFFVSLHELFKRRDSFLLIERHGEKDGFHRIVTALVGCRLRVPAHRKEQSVEVKLIFASKGAPEFRPSLNGLLNELNKSWNCAAHNISLAKTIRLITVVPLSRK